jgi:hypothetical protein
MPFYSQDYSMEDPMFERNHSYAQHWDSIGIYSTIASLLL